MKWNSLPTNPQTLVAAARVRKQGFQDLVFLGRLLNITDQYTQTLTASYKAGIFQASFGSSAPYGAPNEAPKGSWQLPALQPRLWAFSDRFVGFDATTLRVSLGIPFQVKLRYIHAGIGADSLVDLHNQILTLKETIMSLKPLVEKNDDIEDQLSTHDSSLNFDEMEISSTDYQKLQEEYNKLIFQKHKV